MLHVVLPRQEVEIATLVGLGHPFRIKPRVTARRFSRRLPGRAAFQQLSLINLKVKAALAGLKRWPVNISYFDQGSNGGEQTPVYSIGFELYENGISRALVLDYGDFVVSGVMSQLDLKDAAPCK